MAMRIRIVHICSAMLQKHGKLRKVYTESAPKCVPNWSSKIYRIFSDLHWHETKQRQTHTIVSWTTSLSIISFFNFYWIMSLCEAGDPWALQSSDRVTKYEQCSQRRKESNWYIRIRKLFESEKIIAQWRVRLVATCHGSRLWSLSF